MPNHTAPEPELFQTENISLADIAKLARSAKDAHALNEKLAILYAQAQQELLETRKALAEAKIAAVAPPPPLPTVEPTGPETAALSG